MWLITMRIMAVPVLLVRVVWMVAVGIVMVRLAAVCGGQVSVMPTSGKGGNIAFGERHLWRLIGLGFFPDVMHQ